MDVVTILDDSRVRGVQVDTQDAESICVGGRKFMIMDSAWLGVPDLLVAKDRFLCGLSFLVPKNQQVNVISAANRWSDVCARKRSSSDLEASRYPDKSDDCYYTEIYFSDATNAQHRIWQLDFSYWSWLFPETDKKMHAGIVLFDTDSIKEDLGLEIALP